MSRAPARRGPESDQQTTPARAFWSGVGELWDSEEGGAATAGRRTTIDREGIVRAAIAIADAEGLDAVSMRRVATELGTGPMSLYRHVPDKEALVTFMIEAVLGEGPVPEGLPSGDWRADLRRVADLTWQLMRSHPWFAEASMVRPPLTPRAVGGLELMLSLLDGLPVPIGERMVMVMAIHSAVVGAAVNAAIEDRTRAQFSLSPDETHASVAALLGRVAAHGGYPRVTELFAGMAIDDAHEDEHLGAQLELILDGCAARIAAAQQRAGTPPGRRARR